MTTASPLEQGLLLANPEFQPSLVCELMKSKTKAAGAWILLQWVFTFEQHLESWPKPHKGRCSIGTEKITLDKESLQTWHTMGSWSCLFIYYWHLQGSQTWHSLCQGWLQQVQGPVKGQIPAPHPAKECAEEAEAENRLLQLLLLHSKVCMGCRSSIFLNPLLSE